MARPLALPPLALPALALHPLVLCLACVVLGPPLAGRAQSAAGLREHYTLFESGPVRPVALSPDGRALALANTPDNRVELFAIDDRGKLSHRGSVPVGYEPVAVAWRGTKELWVVNHVSDSVSIVAVDPRIITEGGPGRLGYVRRTLLVGDEPRDIVFGGPRRDRAFITTARRGQNVTRAALGEHGIDPQLDTPGLGRAVVWVFDARVDPDSLGGLPLTRIELFTDAPRALAVSPDGRTVYAAGFMTGNRTATVAAPTLRFPLGPGYVPEQIHGVVNQIWSVIVQRRGGHWVDARGRVFDDQIRFDLPDTDVFAVDAAADPPRALAGEVWSGVGTTLFGMAVHPDGQIVVANTEARNAAGIERDVACDVHRPRLSLLSRGGVSRAVDLNPHLPADRCDTRPAERALTLAQPSAVEISTDGGQIFVAALGSSAVGVLDTAAVRRGRWDPDRRSVIPISGGGPTGLVQDPRRNVLYVATRFDNGISVVDLGLRLERQHLTVPHSEPAEVVRGRPLLYDARATSVSGEVSCASCHVFGHTDHLGWDLSDPEADPLPTVWQPSVPTAFLDRFPRIEEAMHTHQQMKGAMVTQSLRGLDNHGPMHWRGDRYDPSVADLPIEQAAVQPDTGLYDELAALLQFNGTFVGLHGLDDELPDDQMEDLARFILGLTYPPNAIRRLDDSLTPQQAAGRRRFHDRDQPADAIGACQTCHTLDPNGNAEFGVPRPGFFGTRGELTFDALPQLFKVPHLRNLYDKVGMFGVPFMGGFLLNRSLYDDADGQPRGAFAHMGPQIRGFGFVHDGSADSLRRYMSFFPFEEKPPNEEQIPFIGDVPLMGIPEDSPDGAVRPRRELEAFLFAFPGDLAPIVGQQVTLSRFNRAAAEDRLDLMAAQAERGACDLVAKTTADGHEVGLYYAAGRPVATDAPPRPRHKRRFVDDQGRVIKYGPLLDDMPAGGELTFTCAVPGAGVRLSLDRDGDCHYDGHERRYGGDPADPDRGPIWRPPAPEIPVPCERWFGAGDNL